MPRDADTGYRTALRWFAKLWWGVTALYLWLLTLSLAIVVPLLLVGLFVEDFAIRTKAELLGLLGWALCVAFSLSYTIWARKLVLRRPTVRWVYMNILPVVLVASSLGRWCTGALSTQRLVGQAAPAGVIIVLSFLWWRGQPSIIARGHCHQCGYNLTGNTSGRCPECGAVVAGVDAVAREERRWWRF